MLLAALVALMMFVPGAIRRVRREIQSAVIPLDGAVVLVAHLPTMTGELRRPSGLGRRRLVLDRLGMNNWRLRYEDLLDGWHLVQRQVAIELEAAYRAHRAKQEQAAPGIRRATT